MKEDATMKILAINSSPRMERGGTALILNAFLDGVKEASAEVELIYLRKFNIKPSLILAMIELESNFDQYCVGAAEDRGYLQIIPGTKNG